MATTDALGLLTALVVSYYIRFPFGEMLPGYMQVVVITPLVGVVVFYAHRLYSPQHLSAWEEFRRVIGATSMTIVAIMLISYWSKSDLSRQWVGLGWVLSLIFILAARRWWSWTIARMRTNGTLAYRTLIVGDNEEGVRLEQVLAEPGTGFVPLARVSTSGSVSPTTSSPSLEHLTTLIADEGVECLFVASTAVTTEEISHVAQAARVTGTEMRISANLPEMLYPRLTLQPYGSVIALSIRPAALTGTQAAAKRALDLTIATLAIAVTSPAMAAIALLVKMTSKGPVIFKQQRVTKGGRLFPMYKFRTMVAGAHDAATNGDIDTTAPFFKLPSDPRLTRVGAFLRRFSLDELPQLFNVLKGEMSLVGPRPLPAEQVAANLSLLGPRHEVATGVTGWWQIRGRSEVDAEDAVRMDLFYIENWSLILDLYIILKTFGVVVSRKGAR